MAALEINVGEDELSTQKPTTAKEKVSIIIVTHNSLPALDRCLASLKESLNGYGHEIITVDNKSTDGSLSAIKKHFPEAQIIKNEKNVGFASACNEGAEKASGEYLLFLNPDVTVDRNAIEQLIATIQTRKDAGAVAGRMRFPDGSFQATCRHLPRWGNMIFSRGSIFSKIIRDGNSYTLPDYETVTPVPAAAGTMMMIRKELFHEVGGFDKRFFMFMEDVDLCLRLNRMGRKNYFVPTAGGVHLWGHGSNAGKLRRNWHHHWAVWKYFRKHYPNIFTFFILPFVLFLNFVLVTVLPVPQPVNRK